MTEYIEHTFSIGSTLYGVAVEGRQPRPLTAFRFEGGTTCPECRSNAVGVMKVLPFHSHWFGGNREHLWYCQACHLSWEHIQLYKCADCNKGYKVYSVEHEGWVCDYCFFIWERGQ